MSRYLLSSEHILRWNSFSKLVVGLLGSRSQNAGQTIAPAKTFRHTTDFDEAECLVGEDLYACEIEGKDKAEF